MDGLEFGVMGERDILSVLHLTLLLLLHVFKYMLMLSDLFLLSDPWCKTVFKLNREWNGSYLFTNQIQVTIVNKWPLFLQTESSSL